MGKLSIAEVLRLRATSAVPRVNLFGAPLRMTIQWEFDEKYPKQGSAYATVVNCRFHDQARTRQA
jgi:hypothetical protein